MIRVAVVGVGGMSRNYRATYAQLPGVEWTLAVDVNAAELEACRAQGAKRVSSNFADALAADIDVLDISTPNHLHEEQAVAALNAGKHVLLQKPMSNTLEGADNIVAAAKKSRGKLGMYMSSFTWPMYWEVKRIIDSGALGQIQSVRARDAHRGGLQAKKEAWRGSLEKTGGGSFIQLSVHAINAIQYWLSSNIVEVSAFSANQLCPNIGGDDVTTAVVKFSSGVYGVFESGYASEGSAREVFGTKGWLRMGKHASEIEMQSDQVYESELARYDTPGKPGLLKFAHPALGDVSNPLNQQRMFLESIRDGKEPPFSGEAGRQDLAVVMAVYESAAAGKAVKVR